MSNKKNKKLVVIHNGVSIDSFNQTISTSTIKNELKLNNTIIVGTVGQLLPLKGQDIFIEAAAQIIPQCSVPVKFLICGRGTPEYETILKKKVTNNNLSDSVIFTGFRSDIPQLMACLDIFALASTYREGLSRVIIEAMASAKPVVAFDTGGNREAVETGFTGMLVPPGDTGLFAAALLQLIHNTNLREEWGSAGRLRIEQHFSINENVRRIQELYKEIL
jgi:glycosyltransferase involved in cell wall biosynthesis